MTRPKISASRSDAASSVSLAVLRSLFLAISLAAVPCLSLAQTSPAGIYSLGQDRMYTLSAFGKRVQKEIEQRSSDLSEENSRLEEALKAEEIALTEQRPTLEPAAFRELAEAFDTKVEKTRTEQASKTVELNAWAEAERSRFYELSYPVLLGFAQEINALAIIEERTLIIAANSINITESVVARIDAAIGDGTVADTPPEETDEQATTP